MMMTTSNSTEISQSISKAWSEQSPSERLRSIKQLAGSDEQATLIDIALNDEHEKVRCSALQFIKSLDVLLKLQDTSSADSKALGERVREGARQQYYRILAGGFAAGVDESRRLEIIRGLSKPALKQVALLAKCKAAGSEALACLKQPEELMDLSLYAASIHVRKNAALGIDDPELMIELREKVRNKDKTLFKLLDQRLSQASTPAPAPTTASNNKKKNPSKELPGSAEVKPEDVSKASSNTDTAPIKKEAVQAVLDPADELTKLETELAKLSHKNTARLNKLSTALNKLAKSTQGLTTDTEAGIKASQSVLDEKLKKNESHQLQLQKNTEALLEKLEQALEAGQSHDAIPAWDKIQGNISNTSGKLRASLQQQANKHKAKLNELRDWKSFAATEKKKELIQQMQRLQQSKMHASDKSRQIRKMHQEWKGHGQSNQNEKLWSEFKKLSDLAYEPCKEFFKQRKQQMSSNLTQRREICQQLEKKLEEMDPENFKITDINKLLNEVEKEWKKHAPIEQSKIKQLQKRYYGVVNQFRNIRKKSLRENARLKKEYIASAVTLAESEDNKNAMNEAKNLQQQWKKLGPTSYKEDKKYWEDFRAACDKIFAKRNQASAEQIDNLHQLEQNIKRILLAIEAVSKLEDDAFRAARGDYQDLLQEFSNALEPRIRQQRKRLLEQFNGLKRNIDDRFKTLPDKKQQKLKLAVLGMCKFIEELENQLLASKDEKQFSEIKNQLDLEPWQAFTAIGKPVLEQALQGRLDCLVDTESLLNLQELTLGSESQCRELCVELEIRADTDTPKQDQSLRMQIQLNQLKNGFGQSRPDRKENSRYALDAELRSFCIGPLEGEIRQELAARVTTAVKRLL